MADEILDIKLDNRKTKSLDPNNNKVVENKEINVSSKNKNQTPQKLESLIKS